jgi:uncharacterized protein YbjT (DUF2867 family)
MRGKVVSIFGGSGFIGRQIVQRLAAAGATLRVATRNPAQAVDLRPMGDPGQIVLVRVALDEDAALERFLDGADAAVNLIGILYERRRGDFERLQAVLPGRIGAAAAARGVAGLVHLSAIGADAGSSSVYARTKAAGEAAIRAAFPDVVILRPSIVFGPGDGFFNRFAQMSQLLPALPLIGGGGTRFQPVFVGDVAAAVVAALERPEAHGRVYELGGPRTYSFAELLRYLLGVLGRRRLLVPLPFAVATLQARLLELLPVPPLTRDQVELLKRDNVVAAGALTLADLGVTPTPLEVVVPSYVQPFGRWKGRVPVA